MTGARKAVRRLKKEKPDGDILVYIRRGSYVLDESVVFDLADSGSRNQIITYAAYPGEEPEFSSGVNITNWEKLTDCPSGLPQAARGHVWVADLPETKGGKWRFFSLFEGDKMLPRARGKGFVPKGDPPADWWQGVFASIEDKSTFGFPEGALKNWDNLEDVEIRTFPAGYVMNILGLESVDEEAGTARTSVPATYPIMRWSRQGDPPSAWVENVIEALEEPGEWVLNTKEGRLYYWPRNDEPGDQIAAPGLTELVLVEGVNDDNGQDDIPVQYLVFRGLTFKHGDRDLWTKDDAGIQHDWEIHDKPSALVRFRGAENCLIDECRFAHTGGTGLRFDLYSQKNRVQRSLFEYLGQAGILIGGYGPGTKDVSFQNQVINNHIHHVGEIYQHGHGIIIWQSRDNLVSNNLIHDGPRKAILVSGVRSHFFDITKVPKENRECSRQIRWHEIGDAQGWDFIAGFLHNHNNIIENNQAYDLCKIGIDGAVINITGNGEGNVIRRNYIHDITNSGPDGVIRLDGNGRGTLIRENVIYNCSPQGIVLNDCNNYVENNIVIDTGVAPKAGRVKYMIHYRGGPRPGRILRNVLYFSDKRGNFFATDSESQRKDYPGDFNLYYSRGAPDSGTALIDRLQKNGTDTHSVSSDPLFVDFERRDFRLRPESPMFIMGFRQIEMDKIGLTDDFPDRYRTGS